MTKKLLSQDEKHWNRINLEGLSQILKGFQSEFCWLLFFPTQQEVDTGTYFDNTYIRYHQREFIIGCLVDTKFDEGKSVDLDLTKAYQLPELFAFQELVALNPRLMTLNYGFIHYEGYLKPFSLSPSQGLKNQLVSQWICDPIRNS